MNGDEMNDTFSDDGAIDRDVVIEEPSAKVKKRSNRSQGILYIFVIKCFFPLK